MDDVTSLALVVVAAYVIGKDVLLLVVGAATGVLDFDEYVFVSGTRPALPYHVVV